MKNLDTGHPVLTRVGSGPWHWHFCMEAKANSVPGYPGGKLPQQGLERSDVLGLEHNSLRTGRLMRNL